MCPPFAAITKDNRLRNCLIARLIVSWLISSQHAVRTFSKCSISRILRHADKLFKHSPDRIVYGIQIRTVRWPILWFIKVWNVSSEKSNIPVSYVYFFVRGGQSLYPNWMGAMAGLAPPGSATA